MCSCVVEHMTSLKLTLPSTHRNPRGKQGHQSHCYIHNTQISASAGGKPRDTQGLWPGFLPSPLQVCLSCHHHFISCPSGLSARVHITFPIEVSKSPSLVPLSNLYPVSFSLSVMKKMTLPQSSVTCIYGHTEFTGTCSEAAFYDLLGVPYSFIQFISQTWILL